MDNIVSVKVHKETLDRIVKSSFLPRYQFQDCESGIYLSYNKEELKRLVVVLFDDYKLLHSVVNDINF